MKKNNMPKSLGDIIRELRLQGVLPARNFSIDSILHPGDFVRQYLEANNLTQQDAAWLMNISRSTLQGILYGTTPITKYTAAKLEAATRVPARFFLILQCLYDDDRARTRHNSCPF